MCRTRLCAIALSFAVALAAGCCSNPSAGAGGPLGTATEDDVRPAAPPADIVGKWRLEVKEGKSSRTSVHRFMKDGSVQVETRLETPDLKVTDLVKRAVVRVEKDQITVVDLSHTGADGVEDVLPAERRRSQTYQIQVKGDELRLIELTEGKKPDAEAKPTVLKRVKE